MPADLFQAIVAAYAASPSMVAALPGGLAPNSARDATPLPYGLIRLRGVTPMAEGNTSTVERVKVEIRVYADSTDAAGAAAAALNAPAPAGLEGARLAFDGPGGPTLCGQLLRVGYAADRPLFQVKPGLLPTYVALEFACVQVRPTPGP